MPTATQVAARVGYRWYSYLLAGLKPHAHVKIHPDAAHGFLFQNHVEFAADVDAFLPGAS